jgi:sulfate permease, SulP family
VREQTAELASFAISDSSFDSPSHPNPRRHYISQPEIIISNTDPSEAFPAESSWRANARSRPEAIREVSEPVSPEASPEPSLPAHFTSALTKMMRNSPQDASQDSRLVEEMEPLQHQKSPEREPIESDTIATEETCLLQNNKDAISKKLGYADDLENQKAERGPILTRIRAAGHNAIDKSRAGAYTISHPKTWNPRLIWRKGFVEPVSVLPAVFLGLLLNLLDALSYGMILFPLGQPIFEDMGSDGISMFYVSTIIAQVVFSSGGSIFKGGIGSEMIEVVPFMHKMAFTILYRVGEDNPKSVLATTILSYALSSILTGIVFFLMGACRLGSLIGFFPRHILIGCIGGVGWFLVVTGLEVSARLDGNLNYDVSTLQKLFQLDAVFLWTIPLVLATILKIAQRFVKSNFLVGGYFISVALLFYFFKFALGFSIQTIRDKGWVFDAPPAGNPWYHFYTLYDFRAVNWEALAETIPAMFALTFFGILHVPINVPALSISTGEDNLNLDRELLAHGVSNALSGLFGSIQNYLVYTNSLLFIDSGGNSRLAGILLAAATAGVLFIGPIIIGYIPIMVVGALIFLLGIELIEEALVDTWGRVHRLEYITILIIVVTMGAWDFVIGIFVGIVLACVNFVVQTSRKSAVRATYSGETANSTVRRPPVQLKFLREAGQQTYIIKLAGFLFFGTIVGVENRIRALLGDDAFRDRPIRYLILDLAHINGVDFSAAEAFTRIGRLLKKRGVLMIVSGVDIDGEIGQSLSSVGLFGDGNEVKLFENLNQALEYCENDLLQALYDRQAQLAALHRPATPRSRSRNLEVPTENDRPSFPSELMFSSPRRHHLQQVASTTLSENIGPQVRGRQYFKKPLPLLLQIFEELSDKGEEFWFRASRFFEKKQYSSGTVLFRLGEPARGFYLLEEGILRAEYESPQDQHSPEDQYSPQGQHSPQGQYSELIMAGRPCGELPFFSETKRTATVTAETDCTAWEMRPDNWAELQKAEPDVASEMLKISLKLTKERMDAVLGYILTAAL